MKKSTIFILAVVYILSIIIVGFFGASIRASNIYVYVESIVLTDPTNTQLIYNETYSNEDRYVFNTTFPTGVSQYTVSLKASVLPNNANEQEVEPIVEENDNYFVTAQGDNVFSITFKNEVSLLGRFRSKDTHHKEVQFLIMFI